MITTLVLVGLQIGLYAYSRYLMDEDEEYVPEEQKRRGSTTVAEEGTTVPLVYGTCRVRKTNVIFYRGDKSFAEYLRVGAPTFPEPQTEKVSLSFGLGICARPVASVSVDFRRLWIGDSLVADSVGLTTVPPGATYPADPAYIVNQPDLWGGPGRGGGVKGALRVFDGDPSQEEHWVSQVIIGTGPNFSSPTQAPSLTTGHHYGGLPGICHMVGNVFTVGERRSMPGFSVEMSIVPDFSAIPVESLVDGTGNENEANPAACMYQLLTDEWVGLGLDGPTKINAASFDAAGDTLRTEGNGFSMVFDDATPATDVIKEIVKQIDGVLYMDAETQEIHLDLIRDDYVLGSLPVFDDDPVLKVASYRETSWADTYNQIRIRYEDRDSEYSEKFAVSQDTASASATRLKTLDISFPGVKVASTANKIAARELQFFSTPQTQVTLHLNREGVSLRPGSVFKWTCSTYNITEMVLRVHKISLGGVDDGVIVVECTRDKYADVSAVWPDPDRSWTDDYGVTPESPGGLVVQEVPPNPFFDAGGSDQNSPDWGMVVGVVEPVDDGLPMDVGIFLTSFTLGEYTEKTTIQETTSTPAAALGTAYSKSLGSQYYYDTTTGLDITTSDTKLLKTSSVEEVAKGKSVLLVGDEYMSYESFTDNNPLSFRSSDSAVSIPSATSVTVTKPAGTIEGDLMVALINTGDTPLTTSPSGWEHVAGSPHQTAPTAGVDNYFAVMTKVAGASEPADYTWDRAAVTLSMGGIIASFPNGEIDWVSFDGHNADHASGDVTDEWVGGVDPTLEEGAVSGTSEMYLAGMAISGANSSGGVSTMSPQGTTPVFTELEDILDPTGADSGHTYLSYATDTTAGDVSTGMTNSADPAQSTHSMVLIGLKGPTVKSYTLNNVWRGLFDTVPVDHASDERVYFMSEVDMGSISLQKKFTSECDTTMRVQSLTKSDRHNDDAPDVFTGVSVTRRAQRPNRPNQFTIIDDGADSVTANPETDYAYDEIDISKTIIGVDTGNDSQSSAAGTFGDVWTNDLRGTWARRPSVVGCEAIIVRGDDADAPYKASEGVRLQIEAKGTQESSWAPLSSRTVGGVEVIDGPTDFIDASKMVSGPGLVRLLACGKDRINGEELDARNAEDLIVDAHSCRQLLLNRNFRPYWDVNSDSSVADLPGNPVYQARGWVNRTIGGGRPRYRVMATPLVQGSASEGFSFTGEFVDGEYVTIEQVVDVPYFDTEDSVIELSWWFMVARTSDEYTATIETLDASGAVLDTATTTAAPALTATEWAKYGLTLSAVSPAARSIRVSLGLKTLLTSTGPAISKVSLVMGREIATDQLVDGDFDVLTGWTATGWTAVASDGALAPVDSVSTNFALAPVTGATGSMSQVVTIPAGYGTGDYVRLQWWGANTGPDDLLGCTLAVRDSGAGTIASHVITGYENDRQDQWYFHEQYVKIPGEAVSIEVTFKSTQAAGAMEVAVDEADLTFIKGEARNVELNWKHTTAQGQPITPIAFATLAQNSRIVPDHIFPMEDGAGVAPVDVVQGATFDTPVGTVDVDYSIGVPVYGIYNGTDHESTRGLEITTSAGGIASPDARLLNPNHRSFGIYLQYRIVEGDSGATASILRKGGNHVTPALGDVTTQLHYDETTHRIHLALAYNSTDAGSFAVNAYVDGTTDDACLHWLYAKVNMVTQTLEVFGDTGAGTSTDISAMITAIEAAGERFENTTDLVEIGNNSDLPANDFPMQIAYMAVLRGRASDLFTRAVGQTMWKHGVCQNVEDTGYNITYARTSRVAYPIASDKVAMWSGSAGGGPVQVPLEFNENWTGDDFLALGCHPLCSNRITFANNLSKWTRVNSFTAVPKLVSERGMREMYVVDANANGGYAYRNVTALTENTTYRVSWFASATTGTHNARVEVTQNDLATTLASLEPSLTTSPSRHTFTFTTQAGQTQLRLKLFGGTAATQTNTGYHGVMITEGTKYGPVIYNDINQNGGGETLAVQTQVLNVTGNELTSPDEGSIHAAYIQTVTDTGAGRSVCEIHGATGSNDRRTMRILAAGTQESEAFDGSGTTYHTTGAHAAVSADSERSRSTKWRRKANLVAGAYTLEDDIISPPSTVTATGTTNTEGTGGHTRIFIACDSAGAGQMSGLQRLNLYSGEVRDTSIVLASSVPTSSAFTADQSKLSGGGGTDHGSLAGLSDDDHAQYLLATGTRASTGAQAFDGGITMGGNTVNDILLSTDGISTANAAMVTAGYLDANYSPVSDHGGLTGLGDDDHTQYLLVAGTRASTGAQTFNAGIAIGGHTITDILISTDGASTSDAAFVTPGWIDANVTSGGTLDTAYDFGGAGAGRAIIADTGSVTLTTDAIGTAETPNLELINSTAALSGSQQHSPMFVLEGQGFKTDAAAASQEVLFALQNVPVQGAASPTGELVFKSNINAAGYVEATRLTSGGLWRGVDGDGQGPTYGFANDIDAGVYLGSVGRVVISAGNTAAMHFLAGKCRVASGVGSASSLQISSQGDTNTGHFWGNSDVTGIATAATEAVRWDANQDQRNAGSIYLLQSERLYLDNDEDTSISGIVDDGIYFQTGGANRIRVAASFVRVFGTGYFGPNIDYETRLGDATRRWNRLHVGRIITEPEAQSSGVLHDYEYTSPLHTGLTASTEVPSMLLDMGQEKSWATGDLATQRFIKIDIPTIGFAGASNVTGDIATVYIEGAPAMGTNATLTGDAWALWIDTGNTRADGNLQVGGDFEHLGSNIGFFGTTPVARSSAYTTAGSTDRTFSSGNMSTSELTDVLGTLIGDLQSFGLLL